MNILIIGSGGREHALAWKMAKSHQCDQLFIAPGNPGTASIGTNLPIATTDFEGLQKAVLEHQIGMIVVGPEDPLVKGIFDFFANNPLTQHINVIGPSAQAAQLEGSKAFSKHFMQRHQIPTASYAEFTADNYNEGVQYLRQHSLPIVLKADGLAAGKGVIIAQTTQEALHSFDDMILQKQFGEASAKVVVEQFLTGIEVSVFALTDGKNYQIIGHAKDYKRIGEGDQGLNTGGMGCVTPVPFMDNAFMQKVEKTIIQPTIEGIAKEGLVYKGFVFFGLMNQNGTPYVIEYNCRLGDPETEVILPRLQTDLVSLLAAVDNGTLEDVNIEYHTASFATVMTVSGGYPGEYKKGYPITGIQEAQALPQTLVFQAGTGFQNDEIVTQGGRVITVTAAGNDLQSAVNTAQKGCDLIQFTDKYFRKDIGYEFA
ncbi:MAG: phosphoribosylamine--glycine ligase [Chitinophagaceae bacterium]|nr:MAG: phosphoribosylamine--glycine ligase [Chitinophagaceae bacterium]